MVTAPIESLPQTVCSRSGEPIPAEPGFLRGHGTLVRPDGALVATVAGVVERVNKLISVRPLRSRYVGEVGDVLVGRVLEVGQKRWKVDVGGRPDAVLMLSSINLPGGEQRRRTAEDQLNMRHFFVEHDLVSAEVQAFFQDGSMSLHTRSLMYGKLRDGTLVAVTPTLMKRLKQHFHAFDFGVHAIFGMNGSVWLSARPPDGGDLDEKRRASAGAPGTGTGVEGPTSPPEEPLTLAERERVCRVRNALIALDQLCITISPPTVSAVYQASLARGLTPRGMLLPQVLPELGKAALAQVTAGQQQQAKRELEDGA
jgi:exosome complex component RRP4